jgi:hypothetical protein
MMENWLRRLAGAFHTLRRKKTEGHYDSELLKLKSLFSWPAAGSESRGAKPSRYLSIPSIASSVAAFGRSPTVLMRPYLLPFASSAVAIELERRDDPILLATICWQRP